MLWILRVLSELPIAAILYKVLPALAGTAFGWLLNGWRWRRYVRRLMSGDASETIVVEQVMVTTHGNVRALRTRIVAVKSADGIFPDNPAAKGRFLAAVAKATGEMPQILFSDPGGGYLFREVRAAIVGHLGQQPFRHEAWVLVLVRVPEGVCDHRSIISFLVRPADLQKTFVEWSKCRALQVEGKGESFKVRALHAIATRFDGEKEGAAERGEPNVLTSMAILDLALDLRCALLPTIVPEWE